MLKDENGFIMTPGDIAAARDIETGGQLAERIEKVFQVASVLKAGWKKRGETVSRGDALAMAVQLCAGSLADQLKRADA